MDAINRDNKYAGTQSSKVELYDVLIALKANIFRTLNVTTFAEVQSIENDIVKVSPFPLVENEATKIINCFAGQVPIWNSETSTTSFVELTTLLTKGDIVMVGFTDRNTIQNFNQTRHGIERSTLLENNDLHSDNYGFIIKVMYKNNA